VLHDYDPSKWEGIGVANGPVVRGAASAMRELGRSYRLTIYSCRAAHPDGVVAIRKFCARHGIPYDDIATNKPAAAMYIDDHGYKFNAWTPTLRDVRLQLGKTKKK